jgi:hypothetical protein
MSAADWWDRAIKAGEAVVSGEDVPPPEPGSAAMTDAEIEAESGAVDATRHASAAGSAARAAKIRMWSLVGLGLAAAAAVGFVAYAVMRRGTK